jgi:hypothetical protein
MPGAASFALTTVAPKWSNLKNYCSKDSSEAFKLG